jgi:two-component system, NarL family, sensor histidine kinase UhpB
MDRTHNTQNSSGRGIGYRTGSAALIAVSGAGVVVLLIVAHALWAGGEPALAVAAVLAAVGVVAVVPIHLWALRSTLAPVDMLLGALATADPAQDARIKLPPGSTPALLQVAVAVERLLGQLRSERQRLRDVAARAFRAQEAERVRIALELQEQTAQELAVSLIRLRAARNAPDGPQRERLLDEMRDDLARATDDVRRYARVLHPPALKDIGVAAAIDAYARSLAASGSLAIVVETQAVAGLLSPEGELALFRIVQEALGNAVRHSRAGRIDVRVAPCDGGVCATIQDDGIGFDVTEKERGAPCLGLFGMQARALSLGGDVRFDSRPGAGTRVQVVLPAYARRPGGRGALPLVLSPAAMPRAGEQGSAD